VTRTDISRGDIWWVEWSPARGSEQAGRRPALVVQRDSANHSPTYDNTIVLALTTRRKGLSFHIDVEPSPANGLTTTSYVMCEQLLTVSKRRLERRLGHVGADRMRRVEAGLRRVLDL
jgi:mRNA interferase MazF